MYFNKYLKYKNKYALLKNQHGGIYWKCIDERKKQSDKINKKVDFEGEELKTLLNECDYKFENLEYIDNIYKNDFSESKCIMIKKKCDKDTYYKFTYNGENLISKINNIREDSKLEKIQKDDLYDMSTRDKCCNCISISLYASMLLGETKISDFFDSIVRTIENVKIGLPDWIVRIVLDISVYNFINEMNTKSIYTEEEVMTNKEMYDKFRKLNDEETSLNESEIYKYKVKLLDIVKNNKKTRKHYEQMQNKSHPFKIDDYIKKKIKTCMNFINIADNTELYVVLCDDKTQISPKMRIMRYMPLYSGDTNIVAIREADGIVTLQDCYNLSIFAKNDDLIYQIYLEPVQAIKYLDENKGSLRTYSKWYSIYKSAIASDFFKDNWTYFDILAGTVAFKLCLKKDSFIERVKVLSNKITNLCNALKEVELVPTEEDKKNMTLYFNKLKDGIFNNNLDVSAYERDLKENPIKKPIKHESNNITNYLNLVNHLNLYTSYQLGYFIIRDTSVEKVFDTFESYLSTGFDEMLLTDIYKPLYSCKIKRDPNNPFIAEICEKNIMVSTKYILKKNDDNMKTFMEKIVDKIFDKIGHLYISNSSVLFCIFTDNVLFYYLNCIKKKPCLDYYIDTYCADIKNGVSFNDSLNYMMNTPFYSNNMTNTMYYVYDFLIKSKGSYDEEIKKIFNNII